MKIRKLITAAFAIIAVTLFAFNVMVAGGVKGTVFPSNGAAKAWAISDKDTFQGNVINGTFTIGNVKPGTYKIAIEAVAPYKNFVKEGVEVRTDEVTDVGEIRLEK